MKKDNSLPIFEMLGLLETEKPKKVKVKPVPAIKVVETKKSVESYKKTEAYFIICCKNGEEVSRTSTEARFLDFMLESAHRRGCETTVLTLAEYSAKYYPNGLTWLIPLKGANNEQSSYIQGQDFSLNRKIT